jgi:hypothetical protein
VFVFGENMEETLKYLDDLGEEQGSRLDYPNPSESKAIMEVTWYLESTLGILVRSLGGHVEDREIRKIAARILCELASDYVDDIVSTASSYWDIEYQRKDARVLP